MWAYHDGFSWWMLFGGMGMVMFWGALIWFGAFMFRSVAVQPQHVSVNHTDDAESILRRRFAAGELTDEEFRHGMETLQQRR